MKPIRNDEPLIFTSKGNIPISSTTYSHKWSDSEEYTSFEEFWHLTSSGELVKNNRHIMAKKPLTIGAEQAAM